MLRKYVYWHPRSNTLIVLWLSAVWALPQWYHLWVWDEGLLRHCSHLHSTGRALMMAPELGKLAFLQQPFQANGAPCLVYPEVSFVFHCSLRTLGRGTSLFSQGILQRYRQCIWHFYRGIRSRKKYEEWKYQGNGPKIGKLVSSGAWSHENMMRLVTALFNWSSLHRKRWFLKEGWFHTWMSTI